MGIQRAMLLQFNSLSPMIKLELTNNESLLKSHGWIYHIMTKGYSLEQSENGIWIHFHGGGLRLNVNMDEVDDLDNIYNKTMLTAYNYNSYHTMAWNI